MDFDWGEYLRLGRALGACGDDQDPKSREAKRRSSTSRAYYSAYHIAKQHLKAKYKMQIGSQHGTVWQGLQMRDRTPEEQQAGRDGDKLMTARHRADYESDCGNAEKQSEYAVKVAAKICMLLGRKI